MKYPKLFEPCKIGKSELKNRIVMPPITTNFAKEGLATEVMVDYYRERAKGGAGLIIVEDAIIDSPVGHHTYDCLVIDDDKYIPSLHCLSQAIKAEGSKASIALNHAGRRAGRVDSGQLLVTRGMIPVAPSAIAHPVTGFVVPRELPLEEIEELEDKFAQAAWRAKEAGFEILSLNCAHMYLISQFLSPLSNQRRDMYGGDFEGRLRFLLQIIYKIKQKVGDELPIICRINGVEPMEGGVSLEDAKEVSRRLESVGVQCISVSVGAGAMLSRRDFLMPVAPMRIPRACMVYLAAAVKTAVSIPVMTANRIVTPELAEQVLKEGKADLIGIGRGLVADPEWPKKAQEGSETEIRHCIACLYCLKRLLEDRSEIRCAVNAAVGREAEYKISYAKEPKTIFIAGGGPAGLESARITALRGHKVHLFEDSALGGQLNIACVPPGKGEMKLFLDFQKRQIEKLGVKIETKSLNAETIKEGKPDAVIVAIGAQPIVPNIPGVDKAVTAWEVLKGQVSPKGKVVIIGGGQVGAETAEYLATKGNNVTIVEMLDKVAIDIPYINRQLLLFSLEDLNVKVLVKAIAEEISEQGVIVNQRGERHLINADAVVLAMGSQPQRELVSQLGKLGIEFQAVGDCVKPQKLPNAVEEGFRAGLLV